MPRRGNTTKVDIAREYRTKYGDKIPRAKLARIIYSENKLLFDNPEQVRGKLRYIAGQSGNRDLRKLGAMGGEFIEKESRPSNPYNLPDSDETSYEPYILKGHKRVAIFADLHIPYHSVNAITAALNFCKKDKPDAMLLNGDILDAFQLSRFIKDPRKRSFAQELEAMQSLLNTFSRVLKCKFYFKFGNHSERYENFLFQKAGELIGIKEFHLENIIKARVDGIEIIKDKRIIKAGGLNIIHGHEFQGGFFNPVNVARGLFLRGKTSALQSHSHQTSEHTESDMNGKVTTTWSTACLCDLHPQFAPINKWNHGFAIVDLDENGNFDVRNKRISKGVVY